MPAKIVQWAEYENYAPAERQKSKSRVSEELKRCPGLERHGRSKLEKFLKEQEICSIYEMDYKLRIEYEKHISIYPNRKQMYLRVYDQVMQYVIRDQMQTLEGKHKYQWGCRYIALFDYDKAGVEDGGEYLRKNMLFEYKVQYCYVKDVTQEEIDKKTYKTDTYMIEDVVTRDEIEKYCRVTGVSNSIGKTLKAKLMSNSIESGEYKLGEQCRTNFKKLFDRMFSYFLK